MRFSHQELLSGLLATLAGNDFTDDPAALKAVFARIGTEFPLLAPFAAGEGSAAVDALAGLESAGTLTRGAGRYALSTAGRARCVSSKRTLFNRADVEQLEGAAAIFAA